MRDARERLIRLLAILMLYGVGSSGIDSALISLSHYVDRQNPASEPSRGTTLVWVAGALAAASLWRAMPRETGALGLGVALCLAAAYGDASSLGWLLVHIAGAAVITGAAFRLGMFLVSDGSNQWVRTLLKSGPAE
jgi:hypothetical protein